MTEFVELVCNAIKLDGYGSSKGFIGYIERSGPYKPGMAEAAVDFFIDFFSSLKLETVIVTSLHVNTDEVARSGEQLDDERDLHLVESVVKAGLVPSFSYDEKFGQDYESDDYQAAVESAWNDFKVVYANDYEPEVFRNFLITRLLVCGLHGHCFLIMEEHALGFYPSDDTGFGVIALKEDAKTSVALDFLAQAARYADFHSVAEK